MSVNIYIFVMMDKIKLFFFLLCHSHFSGNYIERNQNCTLVQSVLINHPNRRTASIEELMITLSTQCLT